MKFIKNPAISFVKLAILLSILVLSIIVVESLNFVKMFGNTANLRIFAAIFYRIG